jgi:hypothetical protein
MGRRASGFADGYVSLADPVWDAIGWIVLAIWTIILTMLARVAYCRDTKLV